MSELGVIVEGILGSVIASYVFYLIVVHLKELADKRVIYPHVTKWACRVVGDCNSQLSAVSIQIEAPLDFHHLEKNHVEAAFKKIDPQSNAPLIFSPNNYANWPQYFLHYKSRSQRYIYKIMSQLIFLDAKLVAHLTRIDDCSHFNFLEMVAHQPASINDMNIFAGTFFEYCIACRELDSYLLGHAAYADMA